jgi:arginine metabolism regulation protein II
MSNGIPNSVPYQDAAQALLDLERFESTSTATTPFSLFRGPFGVSNLSQVPETDVADSAFEDGSSSPAKWCMGLTDLIRQHDNEIDLISSLLDIPNQENNGLELWDPIPDCLDTASYAPDPRAGLAPHFPDNMEAWTILSHYKNRIVPLISPLGHGHEEPWLNLVMPCAVHTLGEITMSGAATHARLALLNALLSTSAFHLANHSALCIEHWISTGNVYLKRAQSHFLRCMEQACTSTMKLSKYKEILMAILSLSTAYVRTHPRNRLMTGYEAQTNMPSPQMVKGDSENRLSCLIQAEKFICFNGFKQSTLSRKRRALHHCYAYMRIMAETTSITDDPSANLSRNDISADEDPAYTDFRICPNIVFSDNIMAMEKDPSVAQRDLHLAIPGRWSLTLFPKMYGVAESFLLLLSQVIRLANERDRSLERRDEGMLNLKDFWVRAKALEKGIHHLMASCTSRHVLTYEESPFQVGDARAQAMYSALLIFFHRRIYDLDAALLQQQVDMVQDSLVRSQQDEIGQGEGNTAALIWPAFIAACEAVDSESQAFFSSWFDSCLTKTGLVNASQAKQIFETIWAKRREAGRYGETWSWPEVLRAKRIRLMFT